jgi:hypothetical protein
VSGGASTASTIDALQLPLAFNLCGLVRLVQSGTFHRKIERFLKRKYYAPIDRLTGNWSTDNIAKGADRMINKGATTKG